MDIVSSSRKRQGDAQGGVTVGQKWSRWDELPPADGEGSSGANEHSSGWEEIGAPTRRAHEIGNGKRIPILPF